MTHMNPWNYPGQNTGVGSLSLLQGIFSNQGSNPGLLNCRRILYQLSHKWSPRILEWVAYPFSRGSSWPRNLTGISCIAGRNSFPYIYILFIHIYILIHIYWGRKWQPTPIFLPGKSHGQRSLAGCSPRGRKSRTKLSDETTTTTIHKYV